MRFHQIWPVILKDTIRSTHWGWDKMATIFQTTFSNAFFFNENAWILIKISLILVFKGWINDVPWLVQIMAWHWPGDKPFSETMTVILLMHICVTQPQWVRKFLEWLKTNPNFAGNSVVNIVPHTIYYTKEIQTNLAKLPLNFNVSLAKLGIFLSVISHWWPK